MQIATLAFSLAPPDTARRKAQERSLSQQNCPHCGGELVGAEILDGTCLSCQWQVEPEWFTIPAHRAAAAC